MTIDNVRFLEEVRLAPEPGRVFVNVTSRGCGSGCSYCYVDGFREVQELVDFDQFRASIDALVSDESFQPGPDGTVVSMCPDTEPFKTPESTDRVLFAAKRVLRLGNPVQFSTKERLPERALAEVADAARRPEQVVWFTSMTTVSAAHQVEPGAAPIIERLRNFERCRAHGMPSCLYIKPFLPSMLRDTDRLIELLLAHPPDSICVGILYKANERGTRSHRHPVHPGLTSRGLDDRFIEFVSRLRQAGDIKIFHSAICVNAWQLDREPSPPIWSSYPELCVSCRGCGQ
ncbi:radical SAM protein [Nonomuraea sp. NPDC050691]|uniref:radical SAM protein n=1 Tax=Nonomuraea sp. NPDC050691 TaxID=3155661 RepID=UPI0033C875D0